MTDVIEVRLEKYISPLSEFMGGIPERQYQFRRIIDNKVEMDGFRSEKVAREYIEKEWNQNPKYNKQWIYKVVN